MTVAYAGHVVGGYGYCDCDGTNCVLAQSRTQGATTSGQPTTNGITASPDEGTAVDPSAGVILLTLALLFGLGLRF